MKYKSNNNDPLDKFGVADSQRFRRKMGISQALVDTGPVAFLLFSDHTSHRKEHNFPVWALSFL